MIFVSSIVIFIIEIINIVIEFWEFGFLRIYLYFLNKLVKDKLKLVFYGVNVYFFELIVLIKLIVESWNIYF